MRVLAAEFFGTFSLVFAGAGAIVINDLNGHVAHVGIALTFGLVVLAMIYAVGDIWGAHINPAVTLAFFAARPLDLFDRSSLGRGIGCGCLRCVQPSGCCTAGEKAC